MQEILKDDLVVCGGTTLGAPGRWVPSPVGNAEDLPRGLCGAKRIMAESRKNALEQASPRSTPDMLGLTLLPHGAILCTAR